MAYATVEELARILQLQAPSAAQTVALQRVLDAATVEIDNTLALTDPLEEPYPPLVVEVNLERAVEHWKQEQSPFGIVAMGGETAPAYTGRNSWRRHAQTLLPLKEGNWGLASLEEIVEAMAGALEPLQATIPGLQITPILNQNPTPPSIDIYPADLFQTGSGFQDDTEAFFTVRARTTTADHEAGQRALLRMLDRRAPESVETALTTDQTLGGKVQAVGVAEEGVSGYREYLEDPQANGRLIGCEWRVLVIT